MSLFSGSGMGGHFNGWWERALARMAEGTRFAYAVRRLADKAVIGTTSYLNIGPKDVGVEIGSTFYRSMRAAAGEAGIRWGCVVQPRVNWRYTG